MWRNIKQKMIHLNVGLLSLGLLYWPPSLSVWPRDKDVRLILPMMKLLQRDFDLVSNSWPTAAEMPFAPLGPVLTPILHTLDMQGEHKGNECVTEAPGVMFGDMHQWHTRSLMENCPPRQQAQTNSRTHDAIKQHRAGARVDCVNKNSTRWTVQHKLTSKDMMCYLQLSFYDCLNIFSKFPTADAEQWTRAVT